MTTWTLIGQTGTDSASAGLRTIALGWTPAIGDLLVFQYVNENGQQLSAVADDKNGAWAVRYTNATNSYGMFDVVVTVAADATVTWTTSFSGGGGACQMLNVSGWRASAGVPTFDLLTGGSSITTTAADDLLLGIAARYPTATVGTGMTFLTPLTNGASFNTRFQYFGSGGTSTSSSAGANNCAFGDGVADIALAYKAVVGGGGGGGKPALYYQNMARQ